MMETDHNGHLIRYNEADDKWECRELDLTANCLSALKTKINDFDAKERRLGDKGVELLHVDSYRRNWSREDAAVVRATLLDKEIDFKGNHALVWITDKDKQRQKVGLHSLMLNTPENIAVLEKAREIETKANLEIKRAQKMVADIPRMTVDQLKALALEVKTV